MPATIKHKRSRTGGNTPTLVTGEFGINEEDEKFFYLDADDVVRGVYLRPAIQQNSQSADYTLVAADAGKQIFHPSADTSARQWTIPANASVPYVIGTAITFINQDGAGVITIAITSDVMRLAGAGTTGNRTLAANGMATAVKVTSTEWIISGTGLS